MIHCLCWPLSPSITIQHNLFYGYTVSDPFVFNSEKKCLELWENGIASEERKEVNIEICSSMYHYSLCIVIHIILRCNLINILDYQQNPLGFSAFQILYFELLLLFVDVLII